MSNKNGSMTQVITVDGHSVVGGPTDLYVYIDSLKQSAGWIKGRAAFKIWFKMQLLQKTDKTAFIQQARQLHAENPKL